MKKLIASGLVGLLAIAMVGAPLALRAQTATNKPATEKRAATEKKAAPRPIPFHGKIKAIDNNAKTLSVGKETFQITSETRITRMNKPATLSDGAEGQEVAGQYRKEADGKLDAISVRFGPKASVDATNTKTNKP